MFISLFNPHNSPEKWIEVLLSHFTSEETDLERLTKKSKIMQLVKRGAVFQAQVAWF